MGHTHAPSLSHVAENQFDFCPIDTQPLALCGEPALNDPTVSQAATGERPSAVQLRLQEFIVVSLNRDLDKA